MSIKPTKVQILEGDECWYLLDEYGLNVLSYENYEFSIRIFDSPQEAWEWCVENHYEPVGLFSPPLLGWTPENCGGLPHELGS